MSFSKWIRGETGTNKGVVYLDPSLYETVHNSLHSDYTSYGRLATRLPDLSLAERGILDRASHWFLPDERVEANEILRRYLPLEE